MRNMANAILEADRKMRAQDDDWRAYCAETNRLYNQFLPGLVGHFAAWLRAKQEAAAAVERIAGQPDNEFIIGEFLRRQ